MRWSCQAKEAERQEGLRMADILIADDTRAIRQTLTILLEEEGHSVRLAANGEEALAEYEKRRPDLLLLDIMMPKRNGYQVLKRIRRDDPALPVIFLSAKGAPADVALGLDLGSDDYLPKPFDGEVLVSRIKAVLRRAGNASAPAADAPETVSSGIAVTGDFRIGSHRVDVKRLTVVDAKGRESALSLRELKILCWFAAHPGEVAMRDTLLNEVWGYSYTGTTRTLDQHILMLRKKLGRDAALIATVHGAGYRYVPGDGGGKGARGAT